MRGRLVYLIGIVAFVLGAVATARYDEPHFTAEWVNGEEWRVEAHRVHGKRVRWTLYRVGAVVDTAKGRVAYLRPPWDSDANRFTVVMEAGSEKALRDVRTGQSLDDHGR